MCLIYLIIVYLDDDEEEQEFELVRTTSRYDKFLQRLSAPISSASAFLRAKMLRGKLNGRHNKKLEEDLEEEDDEMGDILDGDEEDDWLARPGKREAHHYDMVGSKHYNNNNNNGMMDARQHGTKNKKNISSPLHRHQDEEENYLDLPEALLEPRNEEENHEFGMSDE